MRIMIMMAAVAATAGLSVPALAQATSPDGIVLTNTPEMAAGYASKDDCQSTFRQLRNDQRKSGARGGEPYDSMSNSDYNRASRDTTRCEQLDDGNYYVVYNANGF